MGAKRSESKSDHSTVRLGILGTRRGIAFAEAALLLPGVEIGSFCGRDKRRLQIVEEMFPGAQSFPTLEAMLSDDTIDAVIIANYAPEHAPAACAAMRAGKHVLSEVPAFATIAEGVELARTVEATGKVYMLGENFCYLAFVQEMRRLYAEGALGELCYAEGEYVHFARDVLHQLIDVDIPNHWRTWIPPTFYNTHSLGPILHVSGLRPVAVQAATGLLGAGQPGALPRQAPAIELVRLENGALVKSLHGGPFPREPWQPWYLIAGDQGCVENNRWPDPNEVTLYLDKERKASRYLATFPTMQQEAAQTQHWGADLFTLEAFVSAVRRGCTPEIDVYLALDMTLCGNLAWRSILQGGGWIKVPNLRDEAVRKEWEADHYSCAPQTPEEYRLPNHVQSETTVLPSQEFIDALRDRQEEEPYYKAMYRD